MGRANYLEVGLGSNSWSSVICCQRVVVAVPAISANIALFIMITRIAVCWLSLFVSGALSVSTKLGGEKRTQVKPLQSDKNFFI